MAEPGRRRVRRPGPHWHVLAAALVAQTGVSTVEQGIPTLTGFVKASFGLSAATAGLIVASFSFGRVFGSYAAGVAADRFGERRLLVASGIATGAVVCGAAAAPPLAGIVLLLILAGTVSAASTPAGGRLVLLAFPPWRRGLALGIRQTGIPIGGLVAAGLLPWIAHLQSWRWSLGAAGLLAAGAVIPLARSRSAIGGEELDRPEPPTGPSPARNRNVRLLTLWGCCLVSGQSATLAFLALDFHTSAGLALTTASLLLVLAQASGVVGRIVWGAISDRALGRGRKPLLVVLTATALVAALCLLAVPRSAPFAAFVPVAILDGLALIGYQGLWVTMVAEAAGPERVGAATGFSVTFAVATIAASPPLYGLVADLAGTYRAIWGVLACVLAVSFVPALSVRERQ